MHLLRSLYIYEVQLHSITNYQWYYSALHLTEKLAETIGLYSKTRINMSWNFCICNIKLFKWRVRKFKNSLVVYDAIIRLRNELNLFMAF